MTAVAAWVIAILAGAVAVEAMVIWRLWTYVAALQVHGRVASQRVAHAEQAADAWKESAEEIVARREITIPIAPRTGGVMPPILRPPNTQAGRHGG